MKYRIVEDALPESGRPAHIKRGSRRRFKKLKMRGSFDVEMWVLIAWVVFLLLVVLPWMMKHSPSVVNR